MKRTALLLLTAAYLLSSVGVAATSFYCCGVLQSVTFFQGPKHAGSKMASDMAGCCKTKTQYVKIKDRHLGSTGFNLDTKLFPALNAPDFTAYTVPNNREPQHILYNSHAPPDRLKASFYILHCTYRI